MGDEAEKGAAQAPKLGDPISEERLQYLQSIIDAWNAPDADHGEQKGPFDIRVIDQRTRRLSQLTTGADAFRIIAEERERRRLSGADMFWLAAVALGGPDATPPNALDDETALLIDLGLSKLQLEGADLSGAQLGEATLRGAQLGGADLGGADLKGADLGGADLKEADLGGAHLEGADLVGAHLSGASFDKTSQLNDAHLDRARLGEVIFDNTNLTVVEWSKVQRLGDEEFARNMKGYPALRIRPRDPRFFRFAARAYRLLSVALRTQGLSAHATRFHYRAELMDRYALLYEMRNQIFRLKFYAVPGLYLRWLGSWCLGTFAGYGDYVGRLFATYAVVVCSFAALIFIAGHQPLTIDAVRDALVLSVTSFHGRGVQPPGLPLDDAIATLAGAEAVFGLLIEGLFIAAFTRRVTGG